MGSTDEIVYLRCSDDRTNRLRHFVAAQVHDGPVAGPGENGIMAKQISMTSANIPSGAAAQPGLRAGRRWMRPAFPYPLIAVLVILALWEGVVKWAHVPAIVLPPPSAVFLDVMGHWRGLVRQGSVTLVEVVLGFVVSVLVAIPLAIVLSASRIAEKTLYPLIVGSQTVPVVSVAPVLLAWFGFGLQPKIIVVVLITFFPIMMNSFAGMKATSGEILHLARSMGATRWQMFWRFQLPGAMPSVFAGMKVATTLAIVGAVVAEFVGADSGLGYEITVAGSNMNLAHQFAAIFALTVMGLVLFNLMALLERAWLPWHISVRSRAGQR